MEQQTQYTPPLAVFVATQGARGLSVDISVEEFGYKMKPYGHSPEEMALVKYDKFQDPVSLKPVKFGLDGRYEAYDERIVKCLRNHPANDAKGGTEFTEVPESALRHGEPGYAPPVMAEVPEDGVSDKDRELIGYMEEMSTKTTLPPNAVATLCAKMGEAVVRFRIRGLEVPKSGKKLRIIQGKALEILEALESMGVSAKPETIPE